MLTAPKSDSWGFENRRTKLTFGGFVVDPSWTYEVKDLSGGVRWWGWRLTKRGAMKAAVNFILNETL